MVAGESLNVHYTVHSYCKAPYTNLWKHGPSVMLLAQCLIALWAAGGKLQGTVPRVTLGSGIWA